MNTIAIYPNLQKDPKLEYTKKTVEKILEYKKTVLLPEFLESSDLSKIDEAVYLSLEELFKKCDLLVTLGGDGTILNIAKDAARYETPVMGINIGNLGFLTVADKDGFSVFDDVFSGNYYINFCPLLEIEVFESDKKVETFFAFNDAVIKGLDSKMVSLKISVDGFEMSKYSADGVIFSTASGSTAYSMSAGGPIVHPNLKCILITPICAHSLNARSVITPFESVITASTLPPYRCDAILSVDGKTSYTLKDTSYINIKKSDKSTKLLGTYSNSFFDNVREKLNSL